MIIIQVNVYDVLTGYKVLEMTKSERNGSNLFTLVDDLSQNISLIMSEKLTLIRRSYFQKRLKEQEERVRKKIDEEENKENLHDRFNLTIGGSIYPFIYEYKSGNNIIDDDLEREYYIGGIDLFKFGLSVPISLTYYLNKFYSIGFIIEAGYFLGTGNFNSSKDNGNLNFCNNFFINLSVKNKVGKFDSTLNFLFEYGILFELETFMSKTPDTYSGNTYSIQTRYYDGLFIGIGPMLFLGTEIKKKHFSYEAGCIIGCTFGCASKDDYKPDIKFPNYNYIIAGVEMRFNYFYYFDAK